MVAVCNSCDKKFKIETKNPDESYIEYGANKKDSIDYEIRPSLVELNSIEDVIQYNGNLNENNVIFDTNTKPLYTCASCGCSLEKAAFLKLDSSFNEICTSYNNYTMYDIKGYGFSPVKALYLLDIECECGRSHKAVFYKKYDHNGFEITDFNLGNIINSTPLDLIIDGVMSKDDCMELLKKTLIRWELFFEKILIITPFVGHQYLSEEKLIETWFSILSQITSDKAKLITRTASLNTIKRAISNEICDYKVLEEYELSVKHIDEAIKLQPSHAKIYCALTEECSEMIHGSANIVYGPSKEQVTFKRYPSFKILYDNFIKPLDIKNINENECHNKFFDTSNVIFDEAKGFRPEEIKNRELIKNLS
ncbi:hypothetical protein [Vibrio harveyi]|nr:hypothetical protein [Vibrio harveyi]